SPIFRTKSPYCGLILMVPDECEDKPCNSPFATSGVRFVLHAHAHRCMLPNVQSLRDVVSRSKYVSPQERPYTLLMHIELSGFYQHVALAPCLVMRKEHRCLHFGTHPWAQ